MASEEREEFKKEARRDATKLAKEAGLDPTEIAARDTDEDYFIHLIITRRRGLAEIRTLSMLGLELHVVDAGSQLFPAPSELQASIHYGANVMDPFWKRTKKKKWPASTVAEYRKLCAAKPKLYLFQDFLRDLWRAHPDSHQVKWDELAVLRAKFFCDGCDAQHEKWLAGERAKGKAGSPAASKPGVPERDSLTAEIKKLNPRISDATLITISEASFFAFLRDLKKRRRK